MCTRTAAHDAERSYSLREMSTIVYEEVALAEMTYEDSDQMYYYECPCGDKFEISLEDLYDGEDIAPCPSCTLQIKVLFKEVRVRVCVCFCLDG